MLLFRSEEHVQRWNEAHGVAPGATITPQQVWRLATAWYADRLSPRWRRRTPEEVRSIFASMGLTEPFWRLEVSSGGSSDTERG